MPPFAGAATPRRAARPRRRSAGRRSSRAARCRRRRRGSRSSGRGRRPRRRGCSRPAGSEPRRGRGGRRSSRRRAGTRGRVLDELVAGLLLDAAVDADHAPGDVVVDRGPLTGPPHERDHGQPAARRHVQQVLAVAVDAGQLVLGREPAVLRRAARRAGPRSPAGRRSAPRRRARSRRRQVRDSCHKAPRGPGGRHGSSPADERCGCPYPTSRAAALPSGGGSSSRPGEWVGSRAAAAQSTTAFAGSFGSTHTGTSAPGAASQPA